MDITQFTIEEVRCFGERETLEIRPLTFLVGENSTGKTTALACFHALANFLRGRGVDFNEKPSNSHPYSMGTFKDIVRNSRKKEKVFKLGFASKYPNEDVKWTAEFIERKGGVEPTINSVTIAFSDGAVVFKIGGDSEVVMLLTSFDKEQNRYQIVCAPTTFVRFSLSDLLDLLDDLPISFLKGDSSFLKGDSAGKIALTKYLKARANPEKSRNDPWDIWSFLSVFSTSPIRSKPERTYDPMRESNDPEGSDIPMLLMRLEATRNDEWKALETQLVEFGKSSGLFQNIKIKKLGRSLSDPFQLQFKVRGPTSNIMDVGYGISQILPILVQILNPGVSRSTRQMPGQLNFSLLQQPEVHLHPRAQAEFSSLLARLANMGNQSFIVETHSDYMIDRARIEIRKGNIRPEDVSLIYFEPKGNLVKVHNISFDKNANMTGVPSHYGEFFLKETDRLMGFED